MACAAARPRPPPRVRPARGPDPGGRARPRGRARPPGSGPRAGLTRGGVRGRAAAPWYVVGKDVAANILYVDQDRDSPWLLSHALRTEAMHWIEGAPPAAAFDCTAQVRYRQQEEPCHVQVNDDGTVAVRFVRAQRAATPGQSLVLYDGPACIGGAVIAGTDAPSPAA